MIQILKYILIIKKYIFFVLGVELRKVEKIKQKEGERSNALHDVASILARRVAVEISDSDSASGSEYDSDGWAEETCA